MNWDINFPDTIIQFSFNFPSTIGDGTSGLLEFYEIVLK